LHDLGLLERVRVVSGISGGSLLAALWDYGSKGFQEFDAQTTELLHKGLQLDIALHSFWPPAIAARNLMSATRTALLSVTPQTARRRAIRRYHRTDALVTTLRDRAFADRKLPDVTHDGLDVVLSACDLNTGKAVRFGSTCSSCSAFGTILDPIPVAEAVGASAAFPVLLPALERTFQFERDGRRQRHDVRLTDGGIYDKPRDVSP
jgi:NTE family protein